MKNVFVSASVAAVVGVAAAMIAAAAGFGTLTTTRGFQKRMVYATIFLDLRGPNCVITTAPQTVEMWKNEMIEWTIVDGCGVLETPANMVEVRFTGNDPLESGCVKRGKKRIRCQANNAADRGYYKYEVTAPGARTEDPEIEIAQ